MQTVKCFVSRQGQADNSLGKTAEFGELSAYARTFTKDIKYYSLPTHPDLEINVFSAKKDGVDMVGFDTAFVELTLALSAHIYAISPSVDQNIKKADYTTELLTVFFDKIRNPRVGAIKFDAGKTLPEYLRFEMLNVPGAQPGDTNEFILWFSSNAIERDYDEYEIEVVPPLPVLDTFFLPIAEIRQAMARYSITEMFTNIQKIRNKQPESVIRALEIDYVYPVDPLTKISTTWSVLIYGPAGDNDEAIKQALIDYILANSQQTFDNWKVIFPDLFRITQMFMLPLWESMALPNRIQRAGIYSPISGPLDNLRYAKAMLPSLATVFIDDNLQSTHHKYRSITLLAVGGDDNANNQYKLTDYIPDYIAESSTAEDFNRQSEYTKNWTVMMEELLILAEKINDQALMPIGTRRYTLGNQLYIGRKLGKIEYLVATKASIAP